MTRRPYAADSILDQLARSEAPLTVAELADATGWSKTAIRNNLRVMHDWVEKAGVPADRAGRCWQLTPHGRHVANSRGYSTPDGEA